MQASTLLITERIWSPDVRKQYIRRTHDLPNGMLQKSVIRALFGVSRKERVTLFELQLPLELRITLLNECIKICNVLKNNQSKKITEEVAIRAYNRIVGDPMGTNRADGFDIVKETIGFPKALSKEIESNGYYIDEWAERLSYNHTLSLSKLGKKRKADGLENKTRRNGGPKIKTHLFETGQTGQHFWIITIEEAFSKPFWDEYIYAIDEMRFCMGLGGKSDAYVRCSSMEECAIFTTGGRFTYYSLPMTKLEEKIMRLARFVMSFQRSYIHRVYGDDYKVTWDANLLHHVVAPIASAVYSAHSDCSPFLNSPNTSVYHHVHEDVYLPTRGEMQVLTIHYSNYNTTKEDDTDFCTTITYTHNDDHIGSARLGSRGIHIQGPGSQSNGIKHKVTVRPEMVKSGVFRCISTTRLTVSPRHGKVFNDAAKLEGIDLSRNQPHLVRNLSSYDKVSTIQLSQHGSVQPTPNSRTLRKSPLGRVVPTIDESAEEQPTTPKNGQKRNNHDENKNEKHLSQYKKTLLAFPERYPNIPPEIFDEYEISRGFPTIKFQNLIRQLTNAWALLCFLRNGYKVFIRRADGKLYPCLYEFNSTISSSGGTLLKYGQMYSANKVCVDANLHHKDRSHVPVGTKVSSGNIVILTRKYKQDTKKIDAYLSALDRFDIIDDVNGRETSKEPNYGFYDGRITIFGSGGSNNVLGNFAPTGQSSKNDPEIEVGFGQNRDCPINKKLDELAATNSVVAIFLNEQGYAGRSGNGSSSEPCFRFLGYFELFESRYVAGEEHEDICSQFDKTPSDSDWSYMTFRLHPHWRFEARPFIKTLEEVEVLINDDTRTYQSIVLDHNDHSDILFHCIGIPNATTVDYLKLNHTIGVNDLVQQLIESGEIQKYMRPLGVDSSTSTLHQFDEFIPDFRDEESLSFLGRDNGQSINFLDSDSDSDYEPLDERDSIDEDDNETTDSDYEPIAESDLVDEDDKKPAAKKHSIDEDGNGPTVPASHKTVVAVGTSATVSDIVSCCVFVSAANALRYNKKNLRVIGGIVCASPLDEKSLGVTLRTRPTPSPNRTLDVNLCYLRYNFKEYDVVSTAMDDRRRCVLSAIPLAVFEEMMFQIILFRFTGRVYRYEQYRNYFASIHGKVKENERQLVRGIPHRCDLDIFLEYVEKDLRASNTTTLSRWISRQHDGSISHDIRHNFDKFSCFIKFIAQHMKKTVRKMLTLGNDRQGESSQRSKSAKLLVQFITEAMENGSVNKLGRVEWMANSVISDLEEFIVDPFGAVNPCDVPMGVYSQLGHGMVNRSENTKSSFSETLQNIITFIRRDLSEEQLNILGWMISHGNVLNVVNQRPFGAVDSEHFLCKAWLIAKLTFGHSRISKYPKQCNNHTHPSRVLHMLEDAIILETMTQIENVYLNLLTCGCIQLPEFCRLPGESMV
jgi:hypothetical protein